MARGAEAQDSRILVIRTVLEHGPVSRADIAELSGLSTSTVSRSVSYLMTRGVLAEDTARIRTSGRSRIPVMVNPTYGRLAVVVLAAGGATLAVYDMGLTPSAEPEELDVDAHAGTADSLAHAVSRSLGALGVRAGAELGQALRGVGVLRADDSWDCVEGVGEAMRKALGVPAFARRAEDCAEWSILSGADAGRDNHVLVSLGRRVLMGISQGGSQLLLNDVLYADVTPAIAAEGHLGRDDGEAQVVDALVRALELLSMLFRVDRIYVMGGGAAQASPSTAIVPAVPVAPGDLLRGGTGRLPGMAVVAQTGDEMCSLMSQQVRGTLLENGPELMRLGL